MLDFCSASTHRAVSLITGAVCAEQAFQKIGFSVAVMEDSVHLHAPEMPPPLTTDEIDVLGIDDDIMNPTFDVPLELLPPPIPESVQLSEGFSTSVQDSSEAQLVFSDPAATFMLEYAVSMDDVSSNLDHTEGIPTESQRSQFNNKMSSIQVTPAQVSPSVSNPVPYTPRLPRASITAEPTNPQGSDTTRGESIKASHTLLSTIPLNNS